MLGGQRFGMYYGLRVKSHSHLLISDLLNLIPSERRGLGRHFLVNRAAMRHGKTIDMAAAMAKGFEIPRFPRVASAVVATTMARPRGVASRTPGLND